MKLPKFIKLPKLPFKIIRVKKIDPAKRWRYDTDGKTKIPVEDE